MATITMTALLAMRIRRLVAARRPVVVTASAGGFLHR